MSRTASTNDAPSAVLEGKALRQEVFFFDSGGDQIYGSLFVARNRRTARGYVICQPWGWEAYQLRDECFALARRIAERGGASLVFDWVGHGDSPGEAVEATIHRMVEMAGDALAHASVVAPAVGWSICGVRLGACAATLAAAARPTASLLLVQPALDPVEHINEIEGLARRASLGKWDAARPWAFGGPLPDLRDWLPEIDAVSTLESFPGERFVVRFARPPIALPAGVEDVPVDGQWKTGHMRLSQRVLPPLIEVAEAVATRADGSRSR